MQLSNAKIQSLKLSETKKQNADPESFPLKKTTTRIFSTTQNPVALSGVASQVIRPFSKQVLSNDDVTESIWKKRLDEIRNKTLNRRSYLIDLQDKLEEYSKTNTLVVDEEASNKRIKILENKVDNLMIKFNEAMNIKRMYEGLVLNLKQQRTTYDKQIVKMEKASAEKEFNVKNAADFLQKTVSRKQFCSQKFKDYESRRDEVQVVREKYLQNRKNQESEIDSNPRKHALKLKSNDDENAEVASRFSENKSKRMSVAKDNLLKVLSEEKDESVDYNFLEDFFQKIFEITGAKDGTIKSQRNHPKIYQQRRKTKNVGGTQRSQSLETGESGNREEITGMPNSKSAIAVGESRTGNHH